MDCLMKSLTFASLLTLSSLVMAQTGALRDPTLPPAAFLNPLDAPQLAPAELRLEAVRRAQGGMAVAVINGELFRLGGDVAGRRIVRIGESEVVLRGASGRETLRMSPEVGKVKAGQ